MGGGKGGGTSTTNNISKTEIPPEVLARYNAVNARAETVAQQPYQKYSNDPNAFVAGLTPTQQAGIQNTNLMAGAAQPFYGTAAQLAAAGTGNVNPEALNVQQFYNPYTEAVAKPTLQALQQQQAVERSSLMNPQSMRSFGGDRSGVVAANLARQQALGTAQTMNPIYKQAYDQALATAQQQQGVGLGAAQANRQNVQQAAQLFGNLGTGAQQAGLAGAQAQLQAGQAQQQTEQAGKQAMYNQFMQEQGYPFQVAQFLANIATGTGALSGNTTAGTSTTTTQGGGGFFSDERLKENIKKVGETNDGQPIYRYNYKGDPRTQIGLLAQDVEKDHPEAVGLAGGYKTVDYKKATQGAVHKATGGEMTGSPSGTGAYDIDAPSAMLGKPMVGPEAMASMALPMGLAGGRGEIPVRSMTSASEIEAMRAPKATGLSLGSIPAAIAARDTLGSALTGGNEEKLNMGSGRGYIQSEYDRLNKFLEPYNSQYSSQGGLVGPEGGAFARGGYAFGGGPYGVELTPMQQRQVLQGTPMSAPQVQQRQADPLGDATKMAGLVSGGYKLYKDRPDFLRSAEDVAKRKQEELYREKVREEYLKKHGVEPEKVAELTPEDGFSMPEYAARGGLIGNRDGFYGRGYVNPQSYISGVLEDQSEAAPPRKLAHSAEDFKAPKPPEQKGSALGDLGQMASMGKNLYKGGEWAAGKLGLGASPTAMSATSTGMIPEVIDLTSGAGLAAGVPEAAAIAAPEALAGAGAAAEGLGLMGTLGTIGEGIAAALPFLGFLSDERAKHDIKKVGTLFDGQPVYRYAYNGDDKTQMGLLAQKVEKARPEAVGLAGGMKTVDYEKATDKAAKRGHYQSAGGVPVVVPDEYSTAEPDLAPVRAPETPAEPPVRGARAVAPAPGLGAAPPPRPVQVGDSELTVVPRASIPDTTGNAMPVPRPTKPVEPGVAAARRPSIPDVGGLVHEGMKDTLSSENFWVPALAGIGAMLASPNKTLLGAVGSGLVGGTTAYTDLQKQNALQTKQRFELAKDLFKGPIEGDDKKLYWRHVPSGKLVPQEEYERLYSDFVRGSAGTPRSTAPSSETPAVATARGVIAEEPPQPAKGTATPPAPAAAKPEAEAPAPSAAQPQEGQPPAAPVQVEGQPALKNKTQIKNEMLANPQAWAGEPPERNPILLRQQASRLEGEVRQLRDKARRIATTMPENTTEGPRLTAEANQLDLNRKEMIERSEKILDEAAELAYEDQKAQSAGRTAQAVGRTAVPTSPDVPLPQGMTVAQAENDPDYLGSRIESNMKKYNELKARGALKEAGDYYAKVEKDRAQLEKVIGTEYTTPEGTKYSVHPNAEVFNVTQPKPIPKDYKANVDPNTGIVVSKPIGEFIGYPETGGHPVSPALIGKKAVIKGEGDKRLLASKAQSDELEKAFIGGAEKAEEGIATILKFSTAAKVLESKGMNVPYAELANIARGLGFEALANQIMSEKNTAAAFTALKTNVDQAINQVTNNFTRPTQAEFLITEKKATPSIDMPVDAARSLTQTRLAGLMWQNAILSDWENAKRETGATNFAAFRDVWQKTHPKALFEDAADRVLGNFKGQALPKPEKFAEGVVYVVPKNAGDTQVGRALVAKGLRPGDLFVMNGVNHEAKDIGEPTRVSPADAYKAHLRAPALTYGAR